LERTIDDNLTYATPIEDVNVSLDCPRSEKHTKPLPLSAFERLPVKHRQTIHIYPDFPVASKIWHTDIATTHFDVHDCTSDYVAMYTRIVRFKFWHWDATPVRRGCWKRVSMHLGHELLAGKEKIDQV
jgi:hypothetical protein